MTVLLHRRALYGYPYEVMYSCQASWKSSMVSLSE